MFKERNKSSVRILARVSLDSFLEIHSFIPEITYSWEFCEARSNISQCSSTLMQLLFSFDQDMRVEKTFIQTLACQLSSTLMQLLLSFDQDMRVKKTVAQTLACQLSSTLIQTLACQLPSTLQEYFQTFLSTTVFLRKLSV